MSLALCNLDNKSLKSLVVSIKILAVSIGLGGFVVFTPTAFATTTVAGCDNVGWYCDITPKLDRRNLYAQKVSVWTAQESTTSVSTLEGKITALDTQLTSDINTNVITLRSETDVVKNDL